MSQNKSKYLELTGLNSDVDVQADTPDQPSEVLELDPKLAAAVASIASALEASKSKSAVDDPKKEARKAALERAHDIRKFEIELYWKRANYFWLLQAAVFAAVGLTWKVEAGAVHPGLAISAIVPIGLAGLGVVSACAGWLASLGSKFWQRNWEHHVDMLEGEFEGHLYKTVYVGRSGTPWSVSGVSEGLALCFFVFWVLLLGAISLSLNNWDLKPCHLALNSINVLGIQTLIAWALTAGGVAYIFGRGSQVKGTREFYPSDELEREDESMAAEQYANLKGKPHLIRREPSIT